MMGHCVRCERTRPIFHGIGAFRLCRACWTAWRKEVAA